MEWLQTALAIILPLCIVGGVFFFIVRKQQKQTQQLMDTARKAIEEQKSTVWAAAQVISAQLILDESQNPEKIPVKLFLRVSVRNDKPYTAFTTWLVDQIHLPQIQSGTELSVRVNRNHPDHVYPNMPGMQRLSDE